MHNFSQVAARPHGDGMVVWFGVANDYGAFVWEDDANLNTLFVRAADWAGAQAEVGDGFDGVAAGLACGGNPPTCQPTNGGVEACDGVDNDCNGTIDDGIAAVPTSCGVGACASSGTTTCVGGQLVDSCQEGAPTGDDTDCNGIDDDCDGGIDEHYVAPPTSCGVGACASTGAKVCAGGTITDTCQPGDPTPEVCGDDIDNDCDGSTDLADLDADCDGDGVLNGDDACQDTVADAPTGKKGLGTNRWITDGQADFWTKGKNPTGRAYSLAETAGCSCFQIVATCGYGNGHTKHGCSNSVMDAWTGKYDYAGQDPGCKVE